LGRSTVKPDKIEVAKVVKVSDTVYNVKTVETIKVIPQYFAVTDTVIDERHTVDTIYYDSSFTPSAGLYVAQMDTTAADSSYSLMVRFNSMIPLDTRSYFGFNLKTRDKVIKETETIYLERKKGFWDFIKPSISLGAGYGLLNEKFEITIGLGISITP
jgi:hypothetical protein